MAGAAAQEVLLVEDCEIVSQLESLRNVVCNEKLQKERSVGAPTMERSSVNNRYVNVYSAPQYYWEKCFPHLYPYGRGGPSDPFFRIDTLRNYHCLILRRGGGIDGRRFQSSAAHIFTAYTYETRRKVNSMAYAATRGDTVDMNKALTSKAVVGTLLECLSNSKEDEPLDIDVLYARTKELQQPRAEHSTDSSNDAMMNGTAEAPVNDDEVLIQVKRLMQRLVPYANQAPGTAMYMNFMRKNMLAMITAPTVVTRSTWRWFFTLSFADAYESRFYENVIDPFNIPDEWSDREDTVAQYDKKMRQLLLRAHPALVARIFHAKMECIWKYVLHGSDQPLGLILDDMRRVEVSLIVWCLC